MKSNAILSLPVNLAGLELQADENAFVSVDTEAELDEALAAGRSVHLRGEGTEGVIDCVMPKDITANHTTIEGPGVLRFTLDQSANPTPRALTVHANDVSFLNFELVSTQPILTNNCYGIAFSELSENHGHRCRITDLHIHNWCRCISKNPSPVTHEDCLIERLYAHTFRDVGVYLNYGITRLRMRDSRIVGKLPGETHTTHNAFYGGSNWEDCVIENCVFSDVDVAGFEATCLGYQYHHRRTRLRGCRSENCGSMGFSTMFGQGIVIEKCVAKNVKWIGIELGGRPPEFDPGGPFRYGQGIIDGCEVDGVAPAASHGYGQAHGISIDGATDTVVSGATRVSNIPASPDGAAGISITNSERCSVRNATLFEVGNSYIYIHRGVTPNSRGYHEIIGNTFYNRDGHSGAHAAIDVFDTRAEVRQNTSWEMIGTTLNYTCNTVLPAKVTVDGKAVPPGVQTFGGSNVILSAGS